MRFHSGNSVRQTKWVWSIGPAKEAQTTYACPRGAPRVSQLTGAGSKVKAQGKSEIYKAHAQILMKPSKVQTIVIHTPNLSLSILPSAVSMPVVAPGAKVLVTGANGYIAMWLVRTLLEKGYRVRATVRSESKSRHLSEYFKKFGDKLEFVVISDIAKVS